MGGEAVRREEGERLISLSDNQLDLVMRDLPPEKRSVYLKRIVAQLQRRGGFNDADVGAVPNHTRQEIGNQKCAAVRSPKVRPRSA